MMRFSKFPFSKNSRVISLPIVTNTCTRLQHGMTRNVRSGRSVSSLMLLRTLVLHRGSRNFSKKMRGDIYENENITAPPKYGYKVKFNQRFPEKRSQSFTPSFRVIWNMLPLLCRYLWYYLKQKLAGHIIIMDFVKTLKPKQIYGVPIGGIGCGTIGRGFRGEFCRFQMKPGLYETDTVDANQFIITIKDGKEQTLFQSLLSTFKRSKLKAWQSLLNEEKCSYTGLYPRSWSQYDLSEHGIKLTCRQISPVLPHDYENSSLPCAVFVWNVENVSKEKRTVTISFTFKNGTGNTKDDKASTCCTKPFSYEHSEGVILHHMIGKMSCSYALAANTSDDVKVSKCLSFNPNSDGSGPWDELRRNGEFERNKEPKNNQTFGEMACGIAAKFSVEPCGSRNVEMCLVWDMPTIHFTNNTKSYNRFYTKKFGTDNSVLKIVDYSFKNYTQWEQKIFDWQKDVLNNSNLPDWYKSAIFNETYYVSDGGSVWLTLDEDEANKLPQHDPRRVYGRFGYLEGHEYLMYNSYDVHFYASHALYKNWPHLQKCLQYDLKDFVFTSIPDKVKLIEDGKYYPRKVPNTIPHDAGFPGEEPFILINAYFVHDVSTWRDLNSKFVLQSFRDGYAEHPETPNKVLIEDMYDACHVVMQKNIEIGLDKYGLIENAGRADQTYDAWAMTGVSAYCGGLWLAALFAMTKMADLLGKSKDKEFYQNLLNKAKNGYENVLWNGKYYNFDCSQHEATSIMADQLCGQWYLRCCGVKDYNVFPKQNVETALRTLYKNNVKSFCDGKMGAVNGFLNGKEDGFSPQSQEVWTGVTYALASLMLFEGMQEEAFETAGGMYTSMTETLGLAYDTPEALYAKKYLRSLAYMRPLSIWSMQIALENSQSS